ncbi:MAG: DMT family transporter, partial [Actinobacteria bacterium]|nr:DMT family transporter [Actinomycetota bacterium]
MSERRLISTAEGTHSGSFGPSEWGLLAFAGVTWGASFLFIAEALEAFTPAQIGFLRVALAFIALSFLRSARSVPVERADWPRIVVLGVLWMALPFILFPLAEQRVSSSLAGMLNGAVPLFAAAIAAILLRRLPGSKQMIGLLIGLVGLLLIGLPAFTAGTSSIVGVVLVLSAMACYGLSINLTVPVTQKYGALPVIWRSQFVAVVLSAPGALFGIRSTQFDASSFAAILALGIGGTALAYIAMSILAARVGGTRAS